MDIIKVSQTDYKFIFADSGHTLGNLIQNELLRDTENVEFAGKTVPHPLESKMIIRLITSGKSPREIMSNAFNNIISRFDLLAESVTALDQSNESDNKHDNEENKD